MAEELARRPPLRMGRTDLEKARTGIENFRQRSRRKGVPADEQPIGPVSIVNSGNQLIGIGMIS